MSVRLPFEHISISGTRMVDYYLTQPFHEGPVSYNPSPHLALDMVGVDGQIAHAVQGGRVWHAGWEADGWAIGGGWSAIIHHGSEDRPTMRTGYAHGKAIHVTDGQLVRPGQPIITCDALGWATGSHLHFDIQLWSKDLGRWVPVDPYTIFPAHRYRNGAHGDGSSMDDPRARGHIVVTSDTAAFRVRPYANADRLATLRDGAILVWDHNVEGGDVDGSRTWHRGYWRGQGGWMRGYVHSSQAKVG